MQTGCGSAFDQGKGQGKNMRDYQTYIGEKMCIRDSPYTRLIDVEEGGLL